MRTPPTRRLLSPIAAIALLGACGASDEVDDQPLTRRNFVTTDVTDDGLLVRHTDINGDGEPDLSKYFHVRDASGNPVTDPAILRTQRFTDLRLSRKETDTNFDGRIDVVRHYSQAGLPTREESDINFDGSVDLVSLFEEGVRSAATIDTDGDGSPELRRVYRGGALVRVEHYTPGSEAPTLYEYYEDNELVRIGEDFNADSVIDQWTRRRSGNLLAAARPSGPTAGVVSATTGGEATEGGAQPTGSADPAAPAATAETAEPDASSDGSGVAAPPATEGSGSAP